jgi:hypothetical protein
MTLCPSLVGRILISHHSSDDGFQLEREVGESAPGGRGGVSLVGRHLGRRTSIVWSGERLVQGNGRRREASLEGGRGTRRLKSSERARRAL